MFDAKNPTHVERADKLLEAARDALLQVKYDDRGVPHATVLDTVEKATGIPRERVDRNIRDAICMTGGQAAEALVLGLQLAVADHLNQPVN